MPRTAVLSPAPSGRPCAPGGSSSTRRRCLDDPSPSSPSPAPPPVPAPPPASPGSHPLPPPLDEPDSVLPRALEQVHAQLLAAEPPAAAGVEQRHRVGGEPWIVAFDERRLRYDVRAGERRVEAFGRRRPVVARRPRVKAQGTRAERGGSRSRPLELCDAPGLGGGEEIAAAVEPENVAALACQLFEEVDAAVHEGDHVVTRPGPPVPVALGGLVAGERERRPLVDEGEAAHFAPHRQVIGGGG